MSSTLIGSKHVLLSNCVISFGTASFPLSPCFQSFVQCTLLCALLFTICFLMIHPALLPWVHKVFFCSECLIHIAHSLHQCLCFIHIVVQCFSIQTVNVVMLLWWVNFFSLFQVTLCHLCLGSVVLCHQIVIFVT